MSLGTPGEMTTEKLKAPSGDYREKLMYVVTSRAFVIVVCLFNSLNVICQ